MKPIQVSNDGLIAIIIGLEQDQVIAMLVNEKNHQGGLAGFNIDE